MNKCTDCQNETICTGNRRKGSHANCFQPKVKDYPAYLDNPKPTRKQTNYDRIRNMSVEEMAEWLANSNLKQCKKDFLKCIKTNCVNCQKEWLETEVSDE